MAKSRTKRSPATRARTRNPPRRKAARSARTPAARKSKPARRRKATAPPRKSSRPASRLASAARTARQAVTGTVRSIAARAGWGERGSAIELLERDHRRLETLLERGEKTTSRAVKTRTELLETITAELNAHELIEEKVLYPALKAHPEAREVVLEGYQEHHVADVIVQELHALPKGDERWGAKFKVLKENIEHHIEEEEGAMFRTARAVFTRKQLAELGVRMRAMKADALGR